MVLEIVKKIDLAYKKTFTIVVPIYLLRLFPKFEGLRRIEENLNSS